MICRDDINISMLSRSMEIENLEGNINTGQCTVALAKTVCRHTRLTSPTQTPTTLTQQTRTPHLQFHTTPPNPRPTNAFDVVLGTSFFWRR